MSYGYARLTRVAMEKTMKKIPRKWREPALIFILGLLVTVKSHGRPGLLDIDDLEQMALVLTVCVLVFLFRHWQETRQRP